MRRFSALIAAAMIAASVSSALAADLPARVDPPPPPPPPPIFFGGWYVRGDVGVGLNQIDNFQPILLPFNPAGGQAPPIGVLTKSIGDSPLIGGGVGYQFTKWLRADLTGEYRGSANYRVVETYQQGCPVGLAFCLDTYTANVKTALFMGNLYFDLGTWYGVTPYVGGGVGVAFHRLESLIDIGLGQGFAPDRSQDNFAWAAMAGVAYSITPNLKIDVGYRYIDMGRITSAPIVCTQVTGCFFETHSYRADSHDIRIGFRYSFIDPVVAPALVAKY
jgi:opacity protein-like surface antigen